MGIQLDPAYKKKFTLKNLLSLPIRKSKFVRPGVYGIPLMKHKDSRPLSVRPEKSKRRKKRK